MLRHATCHGPAEGERGAARGHRRGEAKRRKARAALDDHSRADSQSLRPAQSPLPRPRQHIQPTPGGSPRTALTQAAAQEARQTHQSEDHAAPSRVPPAPLSPSPPHLPARPRAATRAACALAGGMRAPAAGRARRAAQLGTRSAFISLALSERPGAEHYQTRGDLAGSLVDR